jgi:hypothetical protein
MSDNLPKASLHSELVRLEDELCKIVKRPQVPSEVRGWKSQFSKLTEKVKKAQYPVSLMEHLKIKADREPINSTSVPTWWIAYTVEHGYFTRTELAARLGVSPQAITNRMQHPAKDGQFYGTLEASKLKAKQEEEEKKKNPRINLRGKDSFTAYDAALGVLEDIIDGDKSDNEEKRKVAETILRHVEPKVLQSLREKFETLDRLGTWMITGLIPQANQRVRQLIRDVEARIRNGENTKHMSFDLRTIFRDLLPAFPELQAQIKQQNWGDLDGTEEEKESNEEGREEIKEVGRVA